MILHMLSEQYLKDEDKGSDFATLEEKNFEFIFGSSNQELDPLTYCRSFWSR